MATLTDTSAQFRLVFNAKQPASGWIEAEIRLEAENAPGDIRIILEARAAVYQSEGATFAGDLRNPNFTSGCLELTPIAEPSFSLRMDRGTPRADSTVSLSLDMRLLCPYRAAIPYGDNTVTAKLRVRTADLDDFRKQLANELMSAATQSEDRASGEDKL